MLDINHIMETWRFSQQIACMFTILRFLGRRKIIYFLSTTENQLFFVISTLQFTKKGLSLPPLKTPATDGSILPYTRIPCGTY